MPKDDITRVNWATRKVLDLEKNRAIREFRGVDGEGGNVPEEGTLFGDRHQYLTLRIGGDLLDTGKPLTWQECFSFITSRPRNRIDVAYFFDYDVTMMIRTMPADRAERLLNRSRRIQKVNGGWSIVPLDIGDYQCEYLPHKEFRVRRKGGPWYVISDVGSFFQSSFLSTITKWDIGTPEEREMIRKGKSMRADFAGTDDEIRAYNALECLLLEQLMTDFRAVCEETGYVPKKWQGPGHLATAMLQRHGVPKRDAIPILKNKQFTELAQAAYYGGRFETTAAGPITKPVYQYDINSAYPSVCRTLPCLLHGSWLYTSARPDSGLWFGTVYFNHQGPRYLYNLPVRLKNGNIFFPKEGNGVYWSTELLAAERGRTNIQFQGGWVYENHCDCQWFDFIDAYYQERLRLGKTTKGYVLKLAGNSIYGKIAQSIGYAPYANPVWAGLITAGCRAMLIDAYSQRPDDCYMLATDGLFMGTPLDLPLSRKLGEWELTEHPDGIFIVQPGIYFMNDEVKTRGVERGRISGMRSQFDEQWQKFLASGGVDHTVSVPVQNFITARQAVQRRKWHLAGVWEEATREISFDWSAKRKRNVGFSEEGTFRTIPHDGGSALVSEAYSRIIGGEAVTEERYSDPGLAESARMAEQPDWNEPLF